MRKTAVSCWISLNSPPVAFTLLLLVPSRLLKKNTWRNCCSESQEVRLWLISKVLNKTVSLSQFTWLSTRKVNFWENVFREFVILSRVKDLKFLLSNNCIVKLKRQLKTLERLMIYSLCPSVNLRITLDQSTDYKMTMAMVKLLAPLKYTSGSLLRRNLSTAC